jgi:nucleoside-diphosphate-sugar epimerase
MQTPRILVTGASGFVGRALCQRLLDKGLHVRAAVRTRYVLPEVLPVTVEQIIVGDIGPATDWSEALAGVDVVIHLAARVHVMHEHSADTLASYRHVNVSGTEALARQAASAGVKRLVFLSSIKVNGEATTGLPFSALSPENPKDPYGVSKWEAEQLLSRVMTETGMEVSIIRPPLVYGPGVKANFLRLMQWIGRGVPLPFGLIKNRRSLIFLGNLVDALLLVARHPSAKGRTYLVADREDFSTPQLVRSLAIELGKRPKLLPIPPFTLRLVGMMTGKVAEVERLIGSLQIDASAIHDELGWMPPYSAVEGMQITVQYYKSHKNSGGTI